jgi:hypothetical protein
MRIQSGPVGGAHRIRQLLPPGRVLLRGNRTLPPDRSEWTAPRPDGHPLLVPAQDERVGPIASGDSGVLWRASRPVSHADQARPSCRFRSVCRSAPSPVASAQGLSRLDAHPGLGSKSQSESPSCGPDLGRDPYAGTLSSPGALRPDSPESIDSPSRDFARRDRPWHRCCRRHRAW